VHFDVYRQPNCTCVGRWGGHAPRLDLKRRRFST
jgi:hypothetical protein